MAIIVLQSFFAEVGCIPRLAPVPSLLSRNRFGPRKCRCRAGSSDLLDNDAKTYNFVLSYYAARLKLEPLRVEFIMRTFKTYRAVEKIYISEHQLDLPKGADFDFDGGRVRINGEEYPCPHLYLKQGSWFVPVVE